MSDDRRKLNKHSTGTVPKVKYTVKYRNNTGQQPSYTERENLRDLPNNLGLCWPSRRPESNFHRNSQYTNFELMDSFVEESPQNGVYGNGTATSSQTSSSNSRRNSCGTVPKCDNVTKYPNKKQIEDKLKQIKEYLHITSSLMSSMKSGDDQNSECAIQNSAEEKNDFEDQTNKEIPGDTLNVSLQHLRRKGESRLRDARQLQERLAQGNSSNALRMENNLQEYDLAIAELVETTKRMNGEVKGDVNNFHQQEARFINAEIEELQNQIQVMHSANEDRNKLIELLDKRDAELRCQHLELQNKLSELQSKKSQVDHLVAALQTEPRQDDDVSTHVQRIVVMKDQLAKLKDMLELVENTEVIMQNGTQEEQALACEIYNKAENFLNKDIEKGTASNQSHSDNQQYENRASTSSSLNLDKHMNKNSRETRSLCNESKIGEKLALQAELKAKKKELEEIMGKHKASTSNLNHDVGTDNKSDFSCSNSIFDNVSGVWAPLLPSQQNRPDSSDRYSSDDGTEDANDYSEIPSNQPIAPMVNGLNSTKYTSERNNSSDFLLGQSYERMFRSPENTRGSTIEPNSTFSRGSSVSNLGQVGKQNVQKQLELIRSVCDSMLPQQTNNSTNNNNQQQNVQNLRNNLTPSPIYSELRPFSSPNSHPMNALNIVNPSVVDSNCFNPNPNVPYSDVANYHNWLTTNTLQTQAFMLNSLNQCCQMLWLQQRELAQLRSTVTLLQQERLQSPHFNNDNQMSAPLIQNLNQAESQNGKINSICSIPNLNLNQYNAPPPPPVSVDPMSFASNVRNIPENLNQHIWNGQALNNQVAPGNRANNYWDNFRSYSRQNLFSTKNNDGLQNSPMIDRTSNGVQTRSVPIETHSSLPKSNSHHMTTTQENIPQRSCVKPSRRYPNTNIAVVPPDVLNINQNIKNEGLPAPTQNESRSESVGSSPKQSQSNTRRYSNVATSSTENLRRRTEVTANTGNSKSKLFEELRDNVYQEVASLISANEARPHFLIQLFRDLQLISSDPLRLKTLQSIQALISQSLRNSQRADSSPNQEMASSSNEFSLQSTVWSPIPPNSVPRNATILEGLISKRDSMMQTANTFHEIIPFLNDNEHVTLHQHFLETLKQKILETKSFKKAVKDSIFQKHFANVLDDVLSFYNDKPLCTVKIALLQSIRDLLERELSFMNLIHSTGDSQLNDLVSGHQNLLELRCQFPVKSEQQVDIEPAIQIQNEDLAEADQSHVEDDDIEEEEGAVGGFLEPPLDQSGVEIVKKEEESVEAFGAEAESQYQLGLDQVPTRLPIKSKSRSNTPNKDRTSKQDGEH